MRFLLLPSGPLWAALLILGAAAGISLSGATAYSGLFLLALVGCAFFAVQRLAFAAICVPIGAMGCILFFNAVPRQVDSIYYEHLLQYPYIDIFELIYSSYKQNLLGDQEANFAKGSFLLLAQPFVNRNLSYDEMAYLVPNFAVSLVIASLISELSMEFCKNHKISSQKIVRTIRSLSAGFFLISPSVMFFSSDFMKDLYAILFGLLTAILFVRRQWAWLALAVIISFVIRRYNPLMSFCLVMAVKGKGRWDYAMFAGYAVLMLGIIKLNIAAMANMLLSIVYIYMNPLPFRLENWEFPTGLLTFQGLVFAALPVFAVYQVLDRRMRAQGFDRIAISIALFGFLVIAVGYNNMVNLRGESMEIGRGGDNMTRKAFPALPLIDIQFAFVLAWVGTFLASRRKEVTVEMPDASLRNVPPVQTL
ncbi:hypothetical protein [Novosphingobium guangzhouense]|uniref:Uncharacterized protein n=1 Tax=Novosphingobium guangzhouense TaxID=1850347 RepID=A0A2K2FZ47_9SPHN|nr:hypothetical protein [Novosphingobium guangzhouense]PNU04063.1 hypothetical protein A8V01_05520 [Novosphingobium guangzhouense]